RHSTGTRLVLMEMPRLTSSGSQSEIVFPSSTRPRRVVAWVRKAMASVNDVFPAPPCEKRPTFRMLSTVYVFTGSLHPAPRTVGRAMPRAGPEAATVTFWGGYISGTVIRVTPATFRRYVLYRRAGCGQAGFPDCVGAGVWRYSPWVRRW